MENNLLNKTVYLRYFFYEHLNSYLFDSYYGRNKDKEYYKEYKIRSFLSYLKIGFIPKKFYGLIYCVSPIQILLSLIILTWRFFHSSVLYMFTKRTIIVNKNLIFNVGDRTSELLKKTDVRPNELIQILNPYGDKSINGVEEQMSLFAGLYYGDILASYFLSIRTICFQYWKYHSRDVFFRSYASFDFYLSCYFCSHLDSSNSIFFTSTFARWAFLFSSLKMKKVFIQHGIILNKTFTIRLDRINLGYFVNEEQAILCQKLLFKGVDNVKLMGRISLTDEFNKNDGKTIVLLVCCQAYMEQQKKVITDIGKDNKNIYLLVKPHPKDDIKLYISLQQQYGFVIVPKGKNPRVDVLISYKSTLVDEYMSWNIPALVYSEEDFDSNYRNLINNNSI